MFKSLSAIVDQDEKMAIAKATTDHASKILLQIISSNELELDLHFFRSGSVGYNFRHHILYISTYFWLLQ